MIVDVVIEDPKGSTLRHVQDRLTGEWTSYSFPHTARPWPTHYGFIPETVNPVDGDELDVLLLTSAALITGLTVRARPVGVLFRPDADHKILAVAIDDPDVGWIHQFTDVPKREIRSIESWFGEWSITGDWGDEHEANREIVKMRDLAAARQAPNE